MTELSDDELVDLVRSCADESDAYAELWQRHERAARGVARYLLRSRQDADDVVNDSFASVLSAIRHGSGPRNNFRQYLMACVRNGCKSRPGKGRTVATDPADLDVQNVVFEDPDRFSEGGLIANAFASLSADWQQALWMTAVEDRPNDEVASLLGRRPGAIAALAHRAREGFAEAYLAQHQARTTSPDCARISGKLAQYVRGHSGDLDRIRVEQHIGDCVACKRAVDEMRDVNSSLRSLAQLGPSIGGGIVAGTAITFGTAATVGTVASVGGWSVGVLSGALVAKLVVLGALLVPAAVLASGDSPPSSASHGASTPATTTTASKSGSVGGVAAGSDATSGESDRTSGAGLTGATAAPHDEPPSNASANSAGGLSPWSPSATAGPIGGASIGALVEAGPSSTITPPSAAVQAGINGVGAVTVAAGSSGIGVSVNATVPVVGLSVSGAVSLPAVSLPGVSLPAVSLPSVTIPSISLPLVTTPVVSLPPVTIPSVTLPSVTLPAVSLPPVTLPTPPLPSVTLPATVPSVTLPIVTIPTIPIHIGLGG